MKFSDFLDEHFLELELVRNRPTKRHRGLWTCFVRNPFDNTSNLTATRVLVFLHRRSPSSDIAQGHGDTAGAAIDALSVQIRGKYLSLRQRSRRRRLYRALYDTAA